MIEKDRVEIVCFRLPSRSQAPDRRRSGEFCNTTFKYCVPIDDRRKFKTNVKYALLVLAS